MFLFVEELFPDAELLLEAVRREKEFGKVLLEKVVVPLSSPNLPIGVRLFHIVDDTV